MEETCGDSMWVTFRKPDNLIDENSLTLTESIHLSAIDHDWSQPRPPTISYVIREVARLAYEKGHNDGTNSALNRIRASLRLPPLSRPS